jgi:hypothetical protein
MVTVDRLGLAIRNDTVGAVALHGESIAWAASAPFEGTAGLESVIADLLGRAGPQRWRRTRVTVAIGPSRCQTRQISGLPPLRDARVASSLVRENVGRFFLRNGVALTAGLAVSARDGAWWCAAFEEPVVDALRTVCHRGGVRLEGMVPTITVLPAAIQGAAITWRDGPVTIGARYADTRLTEARRLVAGAAYEAVEVCGALSALGPEAAAYADAYAAAVTSSFQGLPALLPDAVARSGDVPRWRFAAALVSASAAVTMAVGAPGLAATYSAVRSERESKRLEIEARGTLEDAGELVQFRAALTEYAGLTVSARSSASRLLAEFATALPDSSAIVSFRIDSTGGQVALLAPLAATVLSRLERARIVGNQQIVGPITREKVDGQERERVTLRFDR